MRSLLAFCSSVAIVLAALLAITHFTAVDETVYPPEWSRTMFPPIGVYKTPEELTEPKKRSIKLRDDMLSRTASN